MYIPRSLLSLLIIIYLLFLLGTGRSGGAELAWYRPFLIGLLVIGAAWWAHREQESDDL